MPYRLFLVFYILCLCNFTCVGGSRRNLARVRRQSAIKETSRPQVRLTCDDFPCNAQGTECSMRKGRPECRCISSCPRPQTTGSYVCASDGHIYFNQCFMDHVACTSGVVLQQVPCPSTPSTTSLGTESAPQASTALRSIVVTRGEDVTLRCDASGSPKPSIQWRKTGVNSSLPSAILRGVTTEDHNAALTIHGADLNHEGAYQCFTYNVHGFALIPFQVTLREPIVDEEQCRAFSHDQVRLCSRHSHSHQIFWFYDSNKNVCIRKHAPDCEEITNKFHSQAACENSCSDPCSLPPRQGPCLRFQSRLYFDPISRTCRVFAYGGCHGNRNNFRNIEECERTCGKRPPSVRPKGCSLCNSNLGTSFCDDDFVFAGFLLQSEDPHSSYIEVRVTAVYKDNGGTLDEVLDPRDPEDAIREFDLSVDDRCSCPSFEQLRVDGGSRNREVEVILSGNYKYGIPTISQGNLGILATEINKRRMKSNKKSTVLCSLLNRIRGEGQS